MADPTDWWYYFKKTEQGKFARWTKDRSKDKSTYALKYHIEHTHPAQLSQKLEAERIKEKENFEKNKTQQKLDFVKNPRIALGFGSDEVKLCIFYYV
jgi:hypothetical protein